MIFLPVFLFLAVAAIRCVQTGNNQSDSLSVAKQLTDESAIINPQGNTIETRFNTPDGFARVPVAEHSFADYLRHLPLQADGSKVKYYNGKEKNDEAYMAVVNMDIGSKNLQQCADAVMRLRGEYFYKQKKYDSISFTLTNGFTVTYSNWMAGNRLRVKSNQASWIKTSEPSNTYQDFRTYMDMVFNYAGTLSLSKTLHTKSIQDIFIGDVFIIGGSPGHAVIVTDMAQNHKGEKIFMLAQSYMPAQEIQILRNPADETISPWYRSDFSGDLITPEWTFTKNQLKSW